MHRAYGVRGAQRRRGGQASASLPSGVDWALLGVAILISQLGQVLLKEGATGGLPPAEEGMLASLLAQLLRWQTLSGLGCYGGATLLYILALRRIPMSVALPCTAASYVSATLLGAWLFDEALGGQKVLGLLLICVGVVLLAAPLAAPRAAAQPPPPMVAAHARARPGGWRRD